MSGLDINYHKSSIVHWLREDEWCRDMSRILQCRLEKLPFKYLRVPLGRDASNSKVWKPVLDKIKSRLALWQSSLLSQTGRAQIIKYVLRNLPSYYLSLFKIPDKIAK